MSKSARIAARMRPCDAEALRQAARTVDLTVSAFVRAAALRAARCILHRAKKTEVDEERARVS